MATTPARPTRSPISPVRPRRSAPPVANAITLPTSGTPATRSPASELETCCSADARRTQGIPISATAKAATQRHRRRTARRSTRVMAIGSRIAAAIAARPNTSVAGVTSATATRMKKYGMPQTTDIRPNRSRPRCVTRAFRCELSWPRSSQTRETPVWRPPRGGGPGPLPLVLACATARPFLSRARASGTIAPSQTRGPERPRCPALLPRAAAAGSP